MSLTPETGAGLSNADSYISLAEATARHANLGNTAWAAAADDTTREQALRKATEYMEQAYRDRWHGHRHIYTQSLSWPRNSVLVDEFIVVLTTVVPDPVKNACADLALRALTGDLAPDLTRGVLKESVGPIATEYDPASPQATRFRAIELMLAPYLKGASNMARLVRS